MCSHMYNEATMNSTFVLSYGAYCSRRITSLSCAKDNNLIFVNISLDLNRLSNVIQDVPGSRFFLLLEALEISDHINCYDERSERDFPLHFAR
jgi:hypothetical protein